MPSAQASTSSPVEWRRPFDDDDTFHGGWILLHEGDTYQVAELVPGGARVVVTWGKHRGKIGWMTYKG
jgi:hypothetical protein